MFRFAVIPFAFLLAACATTGGQDAPARPMPVVADHPDARLAIALAAELEARAGQGSSLTGVRPEMEALAAAFWSREAVPAAEPEPEIPEVVPPGQSLLYGVHIASYRTLEHALQGWETMRTMLPGTLGTLEPRVEEADLGERGLYLRLKAGPFTTPQAAEAACRALTESAIYCQVMAFTGAPLAAESEN